MRINDVFQLGIIAMVVMMVLVPRPPVEELEKEKQLNMQRDCLIVIAKSLDIPLKLVAEKDAKKSSLVKRLKKDITAKVQSPITEKKIGEQQPEITYGWLWSGIQLTVNPMTIIGTAFFIFLLVCFGKNEIEKRRKANHHQRWATSQTKNIIVYQRTPGETAEEVFDRKEEMESTLETYGNPHGVKVFALYWKDENNPMESHDDYLFRVVTLMQDKKSKGLKMSKTKDNSKKKEKFIKESLQNSNVEWDM